MFLQTILFVNIIKEYIFQEEKNDHSLEHNLFDSENNVDLSFLGG